MKRMYNIINSLPRGAQSQVAKEFGVDRSYISNVLSGIKKGDKAIMILERLIQIIAKQKEKEVHDKLWNEHVEPLLKKSSGVQKVRRHWKVY